MYSFWSQPQSIAGSQVSHSRPIILPKLILPKPSKVLLLPLLRNLLDLLRRKLERSHTQHIAQALLLGTSRYGHNILVNTPTERDLAFADGVFLGEGGEDGVAGTCDALEVVGGLRLEGWRR